jgi:hypothetical protein
MKRITILALAALILVPVSAQALDTGELLATIAMPLAVAAAADIAGVPQEQLGNLVAALNEAEVPVVEQVHIIRYVPVALVETRTETPFVDFVRQQIAQGITGTALVPVVTQRLQTYYTEQVVVTEPARQTIVVQEPWIPQVVVTRAAEVRSGHPHGGPPGQIKKQLGLQTGAEVVHGRKPGRKVRETAPGVVYNPPMVSSSPAVEAPRGAGHGHGQGHGPKAGGPPGQQKAKGGKGHGKG